MAQAFDLVLMTHPASVSRLPDECVLVEEDFTINYTAAGRCLYKPYLGVAYRDKGHTLKAWFFVLGVELKLCLS